MPATWGPLRPMCTRGATRDEWANGYHVMVDTEELVTVRRDQVVSAG